MMRKVAVGAAGSAAAASPSTSHAYSRPAARGPHTGAQTVPAPSAGCPSLSRAAGRPFPAAVLQHRPLPLLLRGSPLTSLPAVQTFDFGGKHAAPAETWEWVFPEDEVRETVTQVLGFDPRWVRPLLCTHACAPPRAPAHHCASCRAEPTAVVEEIRDDNSAGSSDDSASTSLMAEADQRIISQARLQENFGSSLLSLVRPSAAGLLRVAPRQHGASC